MAFSDKQGHRLSPFLPFVQVFVVAYRGDEVILLGTNDYKEDWKSLPQHDDHLSLPATTLLNGQSERDAVADALSHVGDRGKALAIRFIDRFYRDGKSGGFVNGELCLIYSCDFEGYFNGRGVKVSELPDVLPKYQKDIVSMVDKWRQRRERLKSDLERFIKEIAGDKEVGNDT